MLSVSSTGIVCSLMCVLVSGYAAGVSWSLNATIDFRYRSALHMCDFVKACYIADWFSDTPSLCH